MCLNNVSRVLALHAAIAFKLRPERKTAREIDLRKASRLLRILRAAWNIEPRVVRVGLPCGSWKWGRKGFVALRLASPKRPYTRTWLVYPDVYELWRSNTVDLRGQTFRSAAGAAERDAERLALYTAPITIKAAQYEIAARLADWARRHSGASDLSW